MRYTEKMHARRLYNMLKRKGTHKERCPACREYKIDNYVTSEKQKREICEVCMNFVGITYFAATTCPCCVLGETEAIARSLAALRERGFKC